jgi:hypothetical protein
VRWGTATIEATPVHALRIGASLTLAGLAALPGICAVAQEQSADDLIDRIRQIQGEIESGGQAPPRQDMDAQAALRPELGEDEIRAIVRQSLGVEILRVEVVEHEGAPAYAITVMNPGGDRNDAFRVATLLFDGATGSLLGQQSPAPRTAAPELSTAPTPSGFESGGREIRRRTSR